MKGAPDNLASFFLDRARSSRDDKAILYRQDGGWTSVTYGEWAGRAMDVASGLHAAGVEPGTAVVVMARTSYQWLLISWAVAFVGGVLVPVHYTLSEADFEDVLDKVHPSFLFLGDPGLLARLGGLLSPMDGKVALIETECIVSEPRSGTRPFLRLEDVVSNREQVVSLEQVIGFGRASRIDVDVATLADCRGPDSAALVIYTAGTLGEQKAVVLSQASLLFQARTLASELPLTPNDVQLLFLPLSHILGVISYLTSVGAGAPFALGGGMRSLLEDLKDVKPTFMVGVPRVYEKIVEKLNSVTEEFSTWWWEAYSRGIKAGRKVQEARAEGRRPDLASRIQLDLARRSVFQRCREMFGGRMRFLVSGGAALSEELVSTVTAYGIPLLDGFGLTETSGATHMNRPASAVQSGTVGPPVPGVRTRIAEDGEILIKGAGLMSGYLDDPEATSCVIDEDGWLHTGDLGVIERDGCLRITGRKKNLIVTATGKNVVPSKIESALYSIPLISHAIVLGEGKSYLVALVTVSAGKLARWAAQNSILYDSVEKLRSDIRLYREVEAGIEKVNVRLAPYERVRRFAILDSDFSAESGELTFDFKVRRSVVIDKYQDVIDLLYMERY